MKKKGDFENGVTKSKLKYETTPQYKTYKNNVEEVKYNPRSTITIDDINQYLKKAQKTSEYESYLTELEKLKQYQLRINNKYEDAKTKIYEYCESLMFPLYQRMTCVNVTKSTFVSNRAVAGYSYFWGAR
jgi:hypothetical protein